MFYTILDTKRANLLPLLAAFQETFYLAGGTGLALQIGHRDSIDFDFFTEEDINTTTLFERLRVVFAGHTIVKIQEELNTLTVLIDETVKVSFFTYPYPLIDLVIRDANITYASLADIGCMKLSAITGRASNKDYIDLYFLLQRFSLTDLLKKAETKYPQLDRNLILKSLVYFDDVVDEPIVFKNGQDVAFDEVKNGLQRAVKQLAAA